MYSTYSWSFPKVLKTKFWTFWHLGGWIAMLTIYLHYIFAYVSLNNSLHIVLLFVVQQWFSLERKRTWLTTPVCVTSLACCVTNMLITTWLVKIQFFSAQNLSTWWICDYLVQTYKRHTHAHSRALTYSAIKQQKAKTNSTLPNM